MYDLIKTLLFRLDAEEAHEFTVRQMTRVQGLPFALDAIVRLLRVSASPRTVWGLEFANPIGIAAGFDKNAELVALLRALGFGFVEIGTVTLEPQPGNPRPRMFRYPEQSALVNRLGFNNEGATAAARRLEADWNDTRERKAREKQPLFANIGKNKNVPLEAATENYLRCFEIVAPWADGVVVNVSSPNTASLRDLQRPEHLEALLRVVRDARDVTKFVREVGCHPIILKIAPDLDDSQLAEIAEIALKFADGLTATNTTVDRSLLGLAAVETGGLSGKPLMKSSTEVLRKLRELVGDEFPLIGVGGVFSGPDAGAKLAAGANLVQAYTGFIYSGPIFVRKVMAELGGGR